MQPPGTMFFAPGPREGSEHYKEEGRFDRELLRNVLLPRARQQ